MNDPADVIHPPAPAAAPVDATDATDAGRDTADWTTWLMGGLQQGWDQVTGLLWPAVASEPRVFDLGVLDMGSEVRSRNFGSKILLEVVSPDNRALARHEVDSDSIDIVRFTFNCSDFPLEVQSDQLTESRLTYMLSDGEITCRPISVGYPVPPEMPFFPHHPQSHAVI